MTVVNRFDRRDLKVGSTLPVLEVAATEADLQTPINITGYAVYVTFWYVGAAPHKVGQGYVHDGPNGLARYRLDGSETPTAGELEYQFTFSAPGSLDQSVQEWAEISTNLFRRRVMEVDVTP